MERALGRKAKIVTTVRNTEDCAASFVRVAKPDDLHGFLNGHPLVDHLKGSYALLHAGWMEYADRFLFVEYDDLVSDPAAQLRRVEAFLGLAAHEYNFSDIDGASVAENDEEAWGVPGLHDIAPTLGKRHDQCARDVLGARTYEFQQASFWRGETKVTREPHLLDQALAAAVEGDTETGWRLLEELKGLEPDNTRAKFNRGWYVIGQGDLIGGHKLLSAGRSIGVFGNPSPSGAPIWDGLTPQTVLLVLEGGLGDQIHGVRYAREIAARGSKVIVGCDPSLAHLFVDMPAVTAVAARQASGMVFHQSQVLAMDAPATLRLSWGKVDGSAYITRPHRAIPGRIGVRWSGNPQFEHEQHRRFDEQQLFAALAPFCNAFEFVSLQRDEGAELTPSWMKKPDLTTWQDTQREAAKCELVISSCTSVAHLSAAMGVETWILVPKLPYYLWAPLGERTLHYNSVRLFREARYGGWPFAEIRDLLKTKSTRIQERFDVAVG
jgi:hypothetical protein